jgi:hypothetical protein
MSTPNVTQQQPATQGSTEYPTPAQSTTTTLRDTNAFALLSFVLAFLVPIAGIVFGHMSLGQIKRNGDAGRGLALTGLVVSYAYTALLVLLITLYAGMIFLIIAGIGSMPDLPYYDNNF